jgi:hypothetical protein
MPKAMLKLISQLKSKIQPNPQVEILLTKTTTAFATISNPGQGKTGDVILWIRTTMAFAIISNPDQAKAGEVILLTKTTTVSVTTGVMQERNQQISAGTGKAISTDMVRVRVMGIAAEGKNYLNFVQINFGKNYSIENIENRD